MSLILRTDRMELRAATAAQVRSGDLGKELDAELAPPWPPELLGGAVEEIAQITEAAPPGWGAWFWILVDGSQRVVVGNGGFLGGPGEEGFVTLGFEVQPGFRRQGLGREAAAALCEWAFEDPAVGFIDAYAEAENTASIGMLERCGFERAEDPEEDGLVRLLLVRQQIHQD